MMERFYERGGETKQIIVDASHSIDLYFKFFLNQPVIQPEDVWPHWVFDLLHIQFK